MGRTRRGFTPEYKDEAVKLVINTGRKVSTVVRSSVSRSRRWPVGPCLPGQGRRRGGRPGWPERDRACRAAAAAAAQGELGSEA